MGKIVGFMSFQKELEQKAETGQTHLNGFLCLLEWESRRDDAFDIDFTRRHETNGPWPGVAIPEEELDVDLVCGKVHKGDRLFTLAHANDEEQASRLRSVRTHRDARFDTGAFHRDGGHDLACIACATNALCCFGKGSNNVSGRIDGLPLWVNLHRYDVRYKLLGKVETLLAEIGDDNGTATRGFSAEQLHHTNGACTSDEDGHAKAQLSANGGMQADRQRFQEGNLGKRHGVGYLVQPASRVDALRGLVSAHKREEEVHMLQHTLTGNASVCHQREEPNRSRR